MTKYILTAIISITLLTCNTNNTTENENNEESTIIMVQDNDSEMNDAIKSAIHTLDKFALALNSENPNLHSFALKAKYEYNDGVEHLWVGDIEIKDNKYYGIVDNIPEFTTKVKIGDTVIVEREKISDWMYIDDRKLHGGYTLKLLRKRMTELERNQFDSESGLIFD